VDFLRGLHAIFLALQPDVKKHNAL
jgi:hypothetical protein